MTMIRRLAASTAPAGNRPPSDEIAEYAREHVGCRGCGARPGMPCPPDSRWRFRTVCRERFADAAPAYADIWRDAHPAEFGCRYIATTYGAPGSPDYRVWRDPARERHAAELTAKVRAEQAAAPGHD